MPKPTQQINIILHKPESPNDIRHIQNINNRTYARAIAKRLRNTSLTNSEKTYIIESLKNIHIHT